MKGGAPGVETPAHKNGAQGRRTRTAGEALRLRIGHKGGRRSTALTHRAQGRQAVPPLGEAGRGLTG